MNLCLTSCVKSFRVSDRIEVFFIIEAFLIDKCFYTNCSSAAFHIASSMYIRMCYDNFNLMVSILIRRTSNFKKVVNPYFLNYCKLTILGHHFINVSVQNLNNDIKVNCKKI